MSNILQPAGRYIELKKIVVFFFSAVQAIVVRCPHWAMRRYVLIVSSMCRNLLSGVWAVRCRNVVLSTPWPPISLPPLAVSFGGQRLKLVPHLGQDDGDALWFRKMPYEAGVASWVGARVANDYDVVIEIGANVGLYTCLLGILAKGQSRLKRVYAFEPSVEAFRRLQVNLESNKLLGVVTFQAAVAEESGFLDFFQPLGHLTNGSLRKDFAAHFDGGVSGSSVVTIAAIHLMTLLVPGDRALIKIDVEGFEPKLLEALIPLMNQYNPDLIIEILPETESDIVAWAAKTGYVSTLLIEDAVVVQGPIIANPVHRDWLLQRRTG